MKIKTSSWIYKFDFPIYIPKIEVIENYSEDIISVFHLYYIDKNNNILDEDESTKFISFYHYGGNELEEVCKISILDLTFEKLIKNIDLFHYINIEPLRKLLSELEFKTLQLLNEMI